MDDNLLSESLPAERDDSEPIVVITGSSHPSNGPKATSHYQSPSDALKELISLEVSLHIKCRKTRIFIFIFKESKINITKQPKEAVKVKSKSLHIYIHSFNFFFLPKTLKAMLHLSRFVFKNEKVKLEPLIYRRSIYLFIGSVI